MYCAACNTDNPDDAAFCGGCGGDLRAAMRCAGCGRELAGGARFCHGCGTAADVAPKPAAPAIEALAERVATVETDLADMALEIAGLISLKEQLQQALDGMRKRAAGQTEAAEPPPVAAAPTVARPVAPRPTAPAPRPAVTPAQPAPVISAGSERVTIVHFEDQAPLQEAARNVVEKFPYARYYLAREPLNGNATSRTVLAINLVLDSVDPLAAMADATSWGVDSPCALAYCADGERGFLLGMTEFFPPPFEANLCVTRLLERPSPAQRLLVVSDAVEATSELRSILTRLGCATSVAFDAKQGLNLVPMVRPDMVLVDLNLPKGDAFRVLSRMRADAANTNVAFALMWRQPIPQEELRGHLARTARDLPFSGDLLRKALGRQLMPGGVAYGLSQKAS
jgi:CheY-like chemotaxis protein